MKNFIRISLIVALFSVITVACEDDPLPTENYQEEFIGKWKVLEKTGINSPQNYEVDIVRGATENDISIIGLYNIPTVTVKTELFGLGLEIPFQTSDSITFMGSGQATLNFDQITIDFTANDGSGDDQVKAILTR